MGLPLMKWTFLVFLNGALARTPANKSQQWENNSRIRISKCSVLHWWLYICSATSSAHRQIIHPKAKHFMIMLTPPNKTDMTTTEFSFLPDNIRVKWMNEKNPVSSAQQKKNKRMELMARLYIFCLFDGFTVFFFLLLAPNKTGLVKAAKNPATVPFVVNPSQCVKYKSKVIW